MGNEYSGHDQGESSGNVWLKGKASRSLYCSLHGSEAGLPGKSEAMSGEGGVAPEMEQWRQGMQELLARVIELERGIAQSDRRERELLARVEELTRAAARGQGEVRNQVKEISESKAVMGLKVFRGRQSCVQGVAHEVCECHGAAETGNKADPQGN
jgi:hypothetical protein